LRRLWVLRKLTLTFKALRKLRILRKLRKLRKLRRLRKLRKIRKIRDYQEAKVPRGRLRVIRMAGKMRK
jgi:hypothetical protein